MDRLTALRMRSEYALKVGKSLGRVPQGRIEGVGISTNYREPDALTFVVKGRKGRVTATAEQVVALEERLDALDVVLLPEEIVAYDRSMAERHARAVERSVAFHRESLAEAFDQIAVRLQREADEVKQRARRCVGGDGLTAERVQRLAAEQINAIGWMVGNMNVGYLADRANELADMAHDLDEARRALAAFPDPEAA